MWPTSWAWRSRTCASRSWPIRAASRRRCMKAARHYCPTFMLTHCVVAGLPHYFALLGWPSSPVPRSRPARSICPASLRGRRGRSSCCSLRPITAFSPSGLCAVGACGLVAGFGLLTARSESNGVCHRRTRSGEYSTQCRRYSIFRQQAEGRAVARPSHVRKPPGIRAIARQRPRCACRWSSASRRTAWP